MERPKLASNPWYRARRSTLTWSFPGYTQRDKSQKPRWNGFLNAATRNPALERGSPAAILGGELDIDAHYIVIDIEASGGSEWLELTPRDVDSQYSAIRLGFQEGQLVSMILFDSLGQITQIKLLDMKRNNALDIDLFQFTVPEGVDVFDSRQ